MSLMDKCEEEDEEGDDKMDVQSEKEEEDIHEQEMEIN
jgi:hypothetical protein